MGQQAILFVVALATGETVEGHFVVTLADVVLQVHPVGCGVAAGVAEQQLAALRA